MTDDVFDVEAALLYRDTPQIDFGKFMLFFEERARAHDIPGPYVSQAGATTPDCVRLSGNGVHVTVAVQPTPLETSTFEIPLRAPILKKKAYDFKEAIKVHQAGVVIRVGDGEKPVPVDARKSMAELGVATVADPLVKLAVLHVAMQAVAAMHAPLMADFRPSQSLLSPQEIEAVATLGLPIPILFHPFPVSNGRDATGAKRDGLAAIYAHKLIGAELELEAVPRDMPVAMQLDVLSGLIAGKMDGNLPLAHGDALTSDDGKTQWVRHEAGSSEDGLQRIIVSYDTPAPDTGKDGRRQDNTSFQDRVERLKSRAQQDGNLHGEVHYDMRPPTSATSSESEEDLRARVRDTIDPNAGYAPRSALMSGPVKLVIATALVCAVFLFGPTKQISNMVADDASSLRGVKTLLGSPSLATSSRAPSDTNGMVRRLGQSMGR